MPLLRLSKNLARWQTLTSAELFDAAADRVIAQARLVLCAVALIAIEVDPTDPVRYAHAASGILLTYLVFAAAMVAISITGRLGTTGQFLAHLVDLTVIAVLMFLSEGPTSPFFVFFTFVLLSAMMRWKWQAVVATAGIMVAVLVIVSLFELVAPSSSKEYDLNRTLIRGSYLLVAGAMLGYVSAFRERQRERLQKLAHWVAHDVPERGAPSLAKTLAQAASFFEVPRALAIWEESEEPFVNVAYWRNGAYEQTRESAGTLQPLVNAPYEPVAFLMQDARSRVVTAADPATRVADAIINKQLTERFAMSSVASAPFSGTICQGRVFFLDRDTWSDDHVPLIEIVASRVGMELDRQALQLQAQQAAIAQERIRLTRDVHDGILQSLTAAALQLRITDGMPEALQSRIEVVKQLLQSEQRRIRSFVRGVFPRPAGSKDIVVNRDIAQLLSESGRHWDCMTSLSVEPEDARVSSGLGVQISFMLAEAVANAVRHGAASKVHVRIEFRDGSLHIEVRDNGRGITQEPVQLDHQDLTAAGKGPVSLRERVSELGGSLSLASSASGTELHIQVPLP